MGRYASLNRGAPPKEIIPINPPGKLNYYKER